MRAPFTEGRYRWMIVTAAVLFTGLLLYVIRRALVPFVVALVLAYVLLPPVRFLKRHGFSPAVAVLAIYGLTAWLMFLAVAYGFPSFYAELERLAEQLPAYFQQLESWSLAVQHDLARGPLPGGVVTVIDQLLNDLESRLTQTIGRLTDGVVAVAVGLFDLLLAPFLAYYMVTDLDRIKTTIRRQVPYAYRHQVWTLLGDLDRVLSGFIFGRVLVAVAVGMMTATGLWILDIRFALVLSVIAAFAELIPYIGPFIGAAPAVGVAVLDSPQTALYTAGLFVVIQQVESVLISPLVMRDRVGLHPLTIILALLIGGQWFGFAGLVLAVPLFGLIKVVAQFVVTGLYQNGMLKGLEPLGRGDADVDGPGVDESLTLDGQSGIVEEKTWADRNSMEPDRAE